MPELTGIKVLETFSCATTDAELYGSAMHCVMPWLTPWLRLFAYRSAASVFGSDISKDKDKDLTLKDKDEDKDKDLPRVG